MPAVSVVIRSHNSRRHIDRALASLIAQDFSDWEAWVVDDASTDDTAGWIALAYGDEPRLSVLAQPVHAGAAAAANKGLQAATGEYVAFLDADDAWRPPLLSALTAALRTNPEPLAACCDTVQVWDEFGFSRLPPPGLPPGEAAAMLTGNPVPCLSAVLFRTEAIRRLGGLDETLAIAHDRDLLLRCKPGGGLVFGASNAVQSEVPVANYRAMARAWREQEAPSCTVHRGMCACGIGAEHWERFEAEMEVLAGMLWPRERRRGQ